MDPEFIAITFAVPTESATFRRQLRERNGAGGDLDVLSGTVGGMQVCITHVGIGVESAEHRTRMLLQEVRPRLLVAAGFGGALSPLLRVGDVVMDSRGLDRDLPQLPDAIVRGAIETCAHALETVQEKARVFGESGALAVDMETAGIATACAEARVPVIGIRAISDEAGEPLPVPLPAWYDLRKQRARPLVLLGYLATHPNAILPFSRFLQRLPLARNNLSNALVSLCQVSS